MDKYENLIDHLEEYQESAKKEKGHYLFLEEGILCFEEERSDAKYPYGDNGMTFWAHSNGKNHLNESDFFLLPETTEGENSYSSFFLGIKEEKDFHPYSLFSYDKNLFDGEVLRATLFSYHSVLYVLKKGDLYYSVEMALDEKKQWILRGRIHNRGKETEEVYSSFFLNPMLIHGNDTTVETKWFKKCSYKKDTFTFETTEDLSREEHLYHTYYLHRNEKNVTEVDNTTSRLLYATSKTGRICSSSALLKGGFEEKKDVTCFSDLAIAGDFLHATLAPKSSMDFSYVLTKEAERMSIEDIDAYLSSLKNREEKYELFSFEGNREAERFTSFSRMLVKQVDYCATTKNSTLSMLGYRDIFQALEAAVLFSPKMVRERIRACLDYTCLSGRCPRQFAWSDGKSVRVDSREFIDQGLWVIDAIYQYLAYTDDASLLDEMGGYITITPEKTAYKEEVREDLYSHMKRILIYLISHIDPKTECLQTLYGDWNDAINGLGRSSEGKEFSDGVSVMASFQLYGDINKALSIVKAYRKEDEAFLSLLVEGREKIHRGLLAHVFVKKGNETKIIHGWGEHQSFYVGSFDDVDHKERDTLTSNAFYVLSGFSKEENQFEDAVLEAYHKLEGKYGFKTFEPYFDHDAIKVGRIVNLPKGTAENAATYIHGSVFALDSLFFLGEDKWAFDEIHKLVPINHDFISTTPFVMPNSYVYNPEIGCDGESMNDWFTGSSSTLLKSLVRNAFGFDPKIEKLALHLTPYFPYPVSTLSLAIRGKKVKLVHQGEMARDIYLNGKRLDLVPDDRRKTAYVSYTELLDENIIEIK